MQLVIEEITGIACRKVIAVVFVVWQNTGSIRSCNRNISLVCLRSCCQGYRVDVVVTCFEEILWIIRRRSCQTVTPAIERTGLVTVSVLELRQDERIREFHTA